MTESAHPLQAERAAWNSAREAVLSALGLCTAHLSANASNEIAPANRPAIRAALEQAVEAMRRELAALALLAARGDDFDGLTDTAAHDVERRRTELLADIERLSGLADLLDQGDLEGIA